MSKVEKLTLRLQDMRKCPCCGYQRQEFTEWEGQDFTVEAVFTCGARIQIYPDAASVFHVGNGCPNALISKLVEIEQEVEDEIEDELDAEPST